MRKTSLIFLGALVGVVATLLLTQPHTLLIGSAARAAASDTYRKLDLFDDVFERVRAESAVEPTKSENITVT
jgi:carboxyl-terminal processing protease